VGELEGSRERGVVRTFTIVTTKANELVAELHDRMPVVIAPADRARWIAGEDVRELMRPYPAERMTYWPVSREVNSSKNEGASLIDPIQLGDDSGTDEVPSSNEAAPEPANSE
jgi:putative SOS response-associated peptidase YedK